MAGKKQHPGFNEHPSIQKGEGHGRPAEGHAGIDRGMFGGNGGSKAPMPKGGAQEDCEK